MTTAISALRRQAEVNPDGTAFIADGSVWTYGRMAAEVDRLARAMLARGVGAGDRVAFHMSNLPELVLAHYACFRIGAIAAPLNIRFKTAELRPLLARLRPALYLGQAQLYPQIADIESEILPLNRRYIVDHAAMARPWASLFGGSARKALPPEPDPDAVAMLHTTSGTTGVSKLVAHSLATRAAVIEAMVHFGFAEKQVAINSLPMVHAAGLGMMLCCVRYGSPMILVERFDADAVLDAIEIHRGSLLLGLPFMHAELARVQQMRPRRVGSLRICLTAGDATAPSVQAEFLEVFGVPLLSAWGATEGTGALRPAERPGPTGRPAPGAEIRLAGEDGAPVARGEVGELLVRGPNLALGYWKGPDDIDPLAPDGWFHTGDLMRQGEGDELWFVSRKKDLIVRGGSNISPLEVERVLIADPAVRDAAVVGIPDTVLGQRVAAVVELKSGAIGVTAADVLARARTQLADYKLPERLKIVGAIPRTTLGKVDRKVLAAMLSNARADELVVPL